MNKKLSGELERIRRLAKTLARMEQTTVAVYRNDDGTYGFTAEQNTDKQIIEFISQY